jgi:hypothetical protein
LSLASLSISEVLDFLWDWHPPVSEFERGRSRWRTWEEYLADYDEVRDELIANWGEWLEPGEAPFAERRGGA